MSDDTSSHATTGFAALHYIDFTLFIFSKVLSVMSHHMIMVAIAYQIYDLTSEPLNLALIALTMLGPSVGLGLFIGYVVDIFDRRSVLLATFLGLTATTLLILLFTVIHIEVLWPYYVALFFSGCARAFFGPTTNAIVPNLVPMDVFPNAVAWNSTGGKIAQIVGPAAGGLLYLWGPETVYATAAGTFMLGFVTTLMTKRLPVERGKAASFSLRSLSAGLLYVFEKKTLLGAVSVDLIVALLGGATALIPVFARDILEVGPSGAGALRSAIAVGGLLAALVLTRLPFRRRAGMIMLCGVATYGLAMIGFAFSTSFPLSLVMLALAGASDMMNVNVRQTILQIATPDSLRGRVSAVNSVSANLGTELGGFRAGALASVMGTVPAVAIGGVILVFVAMLCPKIFPELASIDRVDRSLAPEA